MPFHDQMPSKAVASSGSHKFSKSGVKLREIKLKNGKVRKLPVLPKKAYALNTEAKRVRPALRTRKPRQLKLKKNLTPGSVCIILAGTHKGKRVVFLKQLPSGTCLVTGPYKLNGCPLRRVPQHLMVTTSLKIDISNVKVPANLDDKYFSKKKAPKSSAKRTKDGDIFEETKQKYELTEERKQTQVAVDSQIVNAISANKEKALICAYLNKPFELTRGMVPHKLKF
ncbi:60S ribosomal protein L6-like isoform X1 [Amphibalanus amphitrite]|uniref:60S ribosomal protein L6-like isoform X1 n=1 Tax=Amphibalanus amphitrite TaxID=1232801 RepID=UPI001C90AEDF|nr:60S ribosomal protein L6-like isoform X1 [Amphibalanus amphitrite]